MRYIKPTIKWLITCLVVGFVAREFVRQWAQLPADAWHLDILSLTACGLLYMFAYLPSLFYWNWCLRRLGQPTPSAAVFRAYFIGHLGKYVPGKALVPILRAALLYPVQVQPAATILAVFYETLTCMAAGAFLVAAFLALQPEVQRLAPQLIIVYCGALYEESWPTWLAAVGFALLGCAMLLPLVPVGFNRLARWLLQRTGSEPAPLQGLGHDVLAIGLIVGVINWWLLGVSVWAAWRAMMPVSLCPSVLWQATFTISAAVVLGFVSLLPGGFGVREGVFALVLAGIGAVTAPQASLLAVVLRLVWIISEVLVALALLTPGWLWRSIRALSPDKTVRPG